MTETQFDFQANIRKALANRQLRSNLSFAMGSMTAKRKAIFSDAAAFEALRAQGNAIRRRALLQLPELLERLEKKCIENGMSVHWAETTDEANRIVLGILRDHHARRLVKGKSMVSEEMHLNRFLADHGVESLETDLGEFIIQLDGETPSHIIVPAIHKNKQEIARTFHEKIPNTPYTEAVEELNAIARKTLRRKFYEGEVGLSGVNMAVAETGTLCLVENEGNGRMCTTVPPVHIAVMGLEKVVEKLSDVPPLLRLLTGSATGQLITTYVNMISGPRKPDEKDGPREIHLILLDNGRSRILSDEQLRQTLQCIRCGTCLNGFIYPGPIGEILTPQMEGLDKAGGIPTASTLCNACEEVCPVKIPIPDLIRRLRNESYDPNGSVPGHGFKRTFAEAAVWKAWALVNRHRGLNALVTKMAPVLSPILPRLGPLEAWTRGRIRPRFSQKSLHERVREKGIKDA